jgi:hypothetical protein
LLAGSLAFAACFNFWAAVYLFAHAAGYADAAAPRYVFGDLRAWGFITLAIALTQFGVAAGLLTGSHRARWIGAGVALLNAFGQIWGLPGYPLWFLVLTAVDMVALFGLAVYGMPSRRAARVTGFRPGSGQHGPA